MNHWESQLLMRLARSAFFCLYHQQPSNSEFAFSLFIFFITRDHKSKVQKAITLAQAFLFILSTEVNAINLKFQKQYFEVSSEEKMVGRVSVVTF
jgi:hypothetical protein